MDTDELVSCWGCGVAPRAFHGLRCLNVYGRSQQIAWLVGLLATWVIG